MAYLTYVLSFALLVASLNGDYWDENKTGKIKFTKWGYWALFFGMFLMVLSIITHYSSSKEIQFKEAEEIKHKLRVDSINTVRFSTQIDSLQRVLDRLSLFEKSSLENDTLLNSIGVTNLRRSEKISSNFLSMQKSLDSSFKSIEIFDYPILPLQLRYTLAINLQDPAFRELQFMIEDLLSLGKIQLGEQATGEIQQVLLEFAPDVLGRRIYNHGTALNFRFESGKSLSLLMKDPREIFMLSKDSMGRLILLVTVYKRAQFPEGESIIKTTSARDLALAEMDISIEFESTKGELVTPKFYGYILLGFAKQPTRVLNVFQSSGILSEEVKDTIPGFGVFNFEKSTMTFLDWDVGTNRSSIFEFPLIL